MCVDHVKSISVFVLRPGHVPKVISKDCQKMYSGLLLMSFVLVEYVMTNKDWGGLGTED